MGKYPYFPKVKTEWSKQQTFDGITIKEVTTPSENPPANYMKIYFKADGKLYKLNSSGAETVSNSTVSAITQALLDAKANINNPSFTGVVTIPNIANLETAVTANTAKVGITSGQASAITANTAKVGITSGQASNITTNNDKVGITSGQTNAIIANTAKVGITSGQASAITANTAKVSLSDNSVTLAKLAHGTGGKYLGFDASGVPAEKDVSSGGQNFDQVINTNVVLADYTAVANSKLTVSSDPDMTGSMSGVTASQTGWQYPLTQSGRQLWVDGDDSTGATSDMGTNNNATQVADFGSNRTGTMYAYFLANSSPTVYFESSTDNSNWTTLSSVNCGSDTSVFHTLTSGGSITFRYLRVRNTNSSGYAWLSLRSIGFDNIGKRALLDINNSTSWESSSESNPYVQIDMGSDLELASLAINLNRNLTTVTTLTIEYSTDTTFSGETVRTLLVSDFTDDTTRFLNIPRQHAEKRYVRIQGTGTGVLSLNYIKYLTEVNATWSLRHYHNYLNPALTSANVLDSN